MKMLLRFQQEYADSVECLGMTADKDFYELGAIVDPIDLYVTIEIDSVHWKNGRVRKIAKGKYDILECVD